MKVIKANNNTSNKLISTTITYIILINKVIVIIAKHVIKEINPIHMLQIIFNLKKNRVPMPFITREKNCRMGQNRFSLSVDVDFYSWLIHPKKNFAETSADRRKPF